MCPLPMFPVLHQQGCNLSVPMSINRVQNFCPQLLIASAFPCISWDDFCLVCKWIQVLSQHTGPSLCPVALALSEGPPTALSLTSAPSWQSPFWFGNSAAPDTTVSDNAAHLLCGILGPVFCLSREGKLLKEVLGESLMLSSGEVWWWTSTMFRGFF